MKKVLLVLGGGIDPVDKISKSLKQRLDVALRLWKTGQYDYIMVSGGIPRTKEVQTVSEASLMTQYLMEQGVDGNELLFEGTSLNTFDNIANSIDILRYCFKDNFRIKIVSHFLHSVRAAITARSLGVKVETTAKIEHKNLKELLKEIVRIVYTLFDSLGESKIVKKMKERRIF